MGEPSGPTPNALPAEPFRGERGRPAGERGRPLFPGEQARPIDPLPGEHGQPPLVGEPAHGAQFRHPARPPGPPPPRVNPDAPTEYIPSLDDDYYDDEYDDYDDDYYDDEPVRRPKISPGLLAVRSIGELLITAGMVVLLFVVYEVWITDLISAGKQNDVTSALEEDWQQPAEPERTEHFTFADGEGIAKLYIPALGSDYKFTIVEGTSEANLEVGPGHYKQSAAPGAPGNFGVAGHRVGKGAPFNDLDLLQSCDAMIVETRGNWYIYRMLPTVDDAKNWAQVGADPLCAGAPGSAKVEPLTGEYAATIGRRIVTPRDSAVVAPVPGNLASKTPAEQRQKLITLTTCHPKFSNRQRMILHGVLVRVHPKSDPALPPELRETR
ncbi:class E sortase [Actinokineospora sp. HBU206404]|uniref:Class E sortase n=2 Tax=Actinokineospora xionganensis TaxID=2684470 RepID=A0ABR7L6M5_9PSEU|nr:class E sortase [Actinokineospora xionganensis]